MMTKEERESKDKKKEERKIGRKGSVNDGKRGQGDVVTEKSI